MTKRTINREREVRVGYEEKSERNFRVIVFRRRRVLKFKGFVNESDKLRLDQRRMTCRANY